MTLNCKGLRHTGCSCVLANDSKEEFLMETGKRRMSTETLVLGAVFTALVAVLQYMGAFVRFGPFSISLVLMPVVIGAALCGRGLGAWLGLVFGVIVLLTGDAAPFMAVNPLGTVITVLAKGTACGFCAAVAYSLLQKYNEGAAVALAAVVCPVINTGIFLVGCLVFFMDTISAWAVEAGLGGSVAHYMIFGLVGINFIIELGVNLVLCPVIVRLIRIRKRN